MSKNELTLNMCVFQGKVISDPLIVPMDDGKCAYLNINTFVDELCANGQWTTNAVTVPLAVTDRRKVEVVERYVKKGKVLLIWGYYKSWHDGQRDRNAIIVTKMKLGPMEGSRQDEDVANRPLAPE